MTDEQVTQLKGLCDDLGASENSTDNKIAMIIAFVLGGLFLGELGDPFLNAVLSKVGEEGEKALQLIATLKARNN